MLKKIVVGLLLLVGAQAQAGQLELSFGPSVDTGSAFSTKLALLGYEQEHPHFTTYEECGFWNNGSLTYVCDVQARVQVQAPSGVYSRIGAGPALISQTDDRLSTNFEFALSGTIGIQQDGWAVGAKFQHFSNAGLKQPNLGRDFLLAVVSIPI